MSYENCSDVKLVELLEANGSPLCVEVAKRWRELLEEDDYKIEEEEGLDVPYFPVTGIQENCAKIRIDRQTIEVSVSDIQGNVSVGAILVIGDSGKFKVWKPSTTIEV